MLEAEQECEALEKDGMPLSSFLALNLMILYSGNYKMPSFIILLCY